METQRAFMTGCAHGMKTAIDAVLCEATYREKASIDRILSILSELQQAAVDMEMEARATVFSDRGSVN